jgi:hypothetical protein
VAEGGHELLHLLALALRAGHFLVPEHEGLKCLLAFFTTELKNRHMFFSSHETLVVECHNIVDKKVCHNIVEKVL